MTATNGTWKFVVWERLNKSGKWCPYSAEVSQFLEISYRKGIEKVPLGDVEENLKIYSVDLKDMVQLSEKTGTKSTVRRHICSDIDTLGNGFIWEWNGNDKDGWHPYDVDVNAFIEESFSKSLKTVTLKKTFRGYNYEIDFTKMLQINKQTKRKRGIRRRQNASPYPVEQNGVNISHESKMDVTEEPPKEEYPGLAQEVPGTSALVLQLNNYLRSVNSDPLSVEPITTTHPIPSAPPCPKPRKKNRKHNKAEVYANHSTADQKDSTAESKSSVTTTYAIVNGQPWYDRWPPPTHASQLKPVPGIEPLPKVNKKSSKKKKVSYDNDVDIFELHTDLVVADSLKTETTEQTCIICCEDLSKGSSYSEDTTIVKLKLCSHVFHKACLKAMYNSGPKDKFLQCPTCKTIHGEKCGTQPPGEMKYHVMPYSLPSFPECETIRIIYDIPSGIQGPEHPNPGKKYTTRGFPRHCYLPDNEMGRKVLRLLVKAWKRRLIFTIGTSSTSGEENTVTWNEIHHKTEFGCNRRGHGYPDPNYFDNILAELEAHGVKDDEVYLWYPA